MINIILIFIVKNTGKSKNINIVFVQQYDKIFTIAIIKEDLPCVRNNAVQQSHKKIRIS